MDNPVTFSDITLLNTLATCANMTTDEVFKDFKIMANKKILKNHKYEIYYSESEKKMCIRDRYSMVGIKNQGKYQKIYDTGKHFVHPLRPAARYAIFKT